MHNYPRPFREGSHISLWFAVFLGLMLFFPFQALNEEIINRKKNVDQAIKNGQALLKQTTGTLKSVPLSTSVVF